MRSYHNAATSAAGKAVAAVGLLGAAGMLCACAGGSFLTQSGPSPGSIVEGASQVVRDTSPGARVRYVIRQVDDGMLGHMTQINAPAPVDPDEHAAYRGEIGIGDVIGMTIFESASGGLFLPREGGTRAGNFVTLPNQQVDRNGNITVPYAGQVKVVGLLPAELGVRVQSLLTARALEPQVIATIAERHADPVSVLGEVGRPRTFSLNPGGLTLLGAVSEAEGPKFPAYESIITLQRAGQVRRLRISDVAETPSLNWGLRPGDTLYVSHEQRYFVAMGAIGQSTALGPVDRRIPFQDSTLTLMDALGRAGGLNDSLANPGAIFVYRLESRAAIGLAPLPAQDAAAPPEVVPTIYLVNLHDPAGFFYASRFPVRGEDVVYVANAPASDLQKFLVLMLGASASSAAIRATTK